MGFLDWLDKLGGNKKTKFIDITPGNMKRTTEPSINSFNKQNDEKFKEGIVNIVTHPNCVEILNGFYRDEVGKTGKNARFGRNGSKELVAAIALQTMDHDLYHIIEYGYQMVFKGEWNALAFSNYMDAVINEKSKISYACWSEVYRYLDAKCPWIENLDMATGRISTNQKKLVIEESELGYWDHEGIVRLINCITLIVSEDVFLDGFSKYEGNSLKESLGNNFVTTTLDLIYCVGQLLDSGIPIIIRSKDSAIRISYHPQKLELIHYSGDDGLFNKLSQSSPQIWGGFNVQLVG